MPPAAVILLSTHVCPQVTPASTPHVGGVILGKGEPTVQIGGFTAACKDDSAICLGPPNSIKTGSLTVFFKDKPAARVGDITEHGGTIATGIFNVIIGG